MKNNSYKKVNITFGGLPIGIFFTVLLAILKVANILSISWLWVFSPIWLPLLIILLVIGILITLYIFSNIF
jgi:hypothetical protein